MSERITATSAVGRLVFHIFGALAQFERGFIRDRTVAGLAAAWARGRRGARPSKLSVDQRRTARRLYDEREYTVEQVGRILGSAAPGATGTVIPGIGRRRSGNAPEALLPSLPEALAAISGAGPEPWEWSLWPLLPALLTFGVAGETAGSPGPH